MCSCAKKMENCNSFCPRWAEFISDLITQLLIRITDEELQNYCLNRNLTVTGNLLYAENNGHIFCAWLINKTHRPGLHWSLWKNWPQTAAQQMYQSLLKCRTAEYQSLSDNVTFAQAKLHATVLMKEPNFLANDGM